MNFPNVFIAETIASPYCVIILFPKTKLHGTSSELVLFSYIYFHDILTLA
jgi:hypothetical protein